MAYTSIDTIRDWELLKGYQSIPNLDVEQAFDELYLTKPKQYDQICKVVRLGKYRTQEMGFEAMDRMPSKEIDGPFIPTTFSEGHVWTQGWGEYGFAFSVGDVAKKYSDQDIMGVAGKKMANAAVQTMEYLAASILDNAFDANVTNGDGKPYIAPDHWFKSEPNIAKSNKLPNAEITMSSYRSIMQQIKTFKGEYNIPKQLRPKNIILYAECDNKFELDKLLSSPNNYENANNEVNVLRKNRLNIIESDYMASSEAYFIDCDENPRNLIKEESPNIIHKGQETNSRNHIMIMRALLGVSFGCGAGVFNTFACESAA